MFLTGHFTLPVVSGGAFVVSGVVNIGVAATDLTIPQDKYAAHIIGRTIAGSGTKCVESVLDHDVWYYVANQIKARTRISVVKTPSATALSKAVIIKAKPGHRPNAADTAGACARMLAKLVSVGIFIVNLLLCEVA